MALDVRGRTSVDEFKTLVHEKMDYIFMQPSDVRQFFSKALGKGQRWKTHHSHHLFVNTGPSNIFTV
eukprot:14638594-Heterocapsa_arctica.AAC.1